MNTVIAFFPDSSRRGRGIGATGVQEVGYILKVEGVAIEQDFNDTLSRDTDDYHLETEDLPRTKGIYVFEGDCLNPDASWDQPQFKGIWRKATVADLKGLIE